MTDPQHHFNVEHSRTIEAFFLKHDVKMETWGHYSSVISDGVCTGYFIAPVSLYEKDDEPFIPAPTDSDVIRGLVKAKLFEHITLRYYDTMPSTVMAVQTKPGREYIETENYPDSFTALLALIEQIESEGDGDA